MTAVVQSQLTEGRGASRPGWLVSEVDLPSAAERPAREPPRPAGLGDADEAELISRCREGDRLALGELYRRYRPEALRLIRHAARNTSDADDILQETFLEVAHSIRSYAGRSGFGGWLRSICVRTALRHMKKRHRQVGESEEHGSSAPLETRVADDDPAEDYERRERSRRVKALLEKLAPKKRMVLLLHDFEGVSPKEISELVGAPVLTVRTRLFYARRELTALAAQDPLLATELQRLLSGPKEGA